MAKLIKRNNNLPTIPDSVPDKVETYAGKHTARVTNTYKQPDGSDVKLTRRINKDLSVSDIIERRHK